MEGERDLKKKRISFDVSYTNAAQSEQFWVNSIVVVHVSPRPNTESHLSSSRRLSCGGSLCRGNLWPGLLDRILDAHNATLGTADGTYTSHKKISKDLDMDTREPKKKDSTYHSQPQYHSQHPPSESSNSEQCSACYPYFQPFSSPGKHANHHPD